jgi:hypothetical protein
MKMTGFLEVKLVASISNETPGLSRSEMLILGKKERESLEICFETSVAGKIRKHEEPLAALLAVFEMIDFLRRKVAAVAY